MAKMNIPVKERPQVKAECLRLLTTLKLDPARMQLISRFVDIYLDLNPVEEEIFIAAVDKIGLSKEEVYMEITTSWERKAAKKTREEIALNLLKKKMLVDEVVETTGLSTEEVQQLQAQLQKEN